MSEVSVYVIANLIVTESEHYRVYEKGFFPLLKKYGGSFITFDDSPVHLEGFSPREGRMIMFTFPLNRQPQIGMQTQTIKPCLSTVVLALDWNL